MQNRNSPKLSSTAKDNGKKAKQSWEL